jgi:GDPmannose 4,6-dehydratase
LKEKVAIIFGSNGQDGFYLKDLLVKERIGVVCISRSAGDYIGSVGDFEFVNKIIKIHKPHYIFHFAAISTTKHDVILENNHSISTGTINILESVKRHSPESKVFISGSALQFKNIGIPIDENTPFDFLSPYAISRIHSVYMARYFRKTFGIKAYVGYFFNHDSPLRSQNHVNQKIVFHVSEILKGNLDKLIIGNINVKKEFNYAKDIVEAVWLMINQDYIYEAVIGSGVAHSIKDWIKYCFDKYSLRWEEYILLDESYKSEYEILVSNPKLINNIGWNPRLSMHELADIMLEAEFKKH